MMTTCLLYLKLEISTILQTVSLVAAGSSIAGGTVTFTDSIHAAAAAASAADQCLRSSFCMMLSAGSMTYATEPLARM